MAELTRFRRRTPSGRRSRRGGALTRRPRPMGEERTRGRRPRLGSPDARWVRAVPAPRSNETDAAGAEASGSWSAAWPRAVGEKRPSMGASGGAITPPANGVGDPARSGDSRGTSARLGPTPGRRRSGAHPSTRSRRRAARRAPEAWAMCTARRRNPSRDGGAGPPEARGPAANPSPRGEARDCARAGPSAGGPRRGDVRRAVHGEGQAVLTQTYIFRARPIPA